MDEGIHVAGVLAGDVVLDVEALHLAREVAAEGAGIELGDRGDAGLAGNDVGPALRHRVAHGTDQTKTGDDDATTTHFRILSGSAKPKTTAAHRGHESPGAAARYRGLTLLR